MRGGRKFAFIFSRNKPKKNIYASNDSGQLIWMVSLFDLPQFSRKYIHSKGINWPYTQAQDMKRRHQYCKQNLMRRKINAHTHTPKEHVKSYQEVFFPDNLYYTADSYCNNGTCKTREGINDEGHWIDGVDAFYTNLCLKKKIFYRWCSYLM